MSTIANAFFKVLEFFEQRKWAVLVLGLVVGVILGLIYAWNIAPVQWKNAGPDELRWDFRNDYLLWVARNYDNLDWARRKLLGVDHGGSADRKIEDVKSYAERVSAALSGLAAECKDNKRPGECNPEDAVRLSALAEEMKIVAEEPADTSRGILPYCLWTFFVLLVVGGGGFLAYRWWRGSQEEQEVREAIAERVRPVTTVAWKGEGPPLAQFPTTYALGDDHFDPSFSIELDNGEFMGECGVGVSETIGVGAPSKVTAFEVWLFDKSDIRTVTKVVMSPYAFGDEALRTKLAPKGEPMQAKEGAEVVLETKTLRVKARIVEAKYGIGNLPQNSFFERLSIDLAAWLKAVPEGEAPLEEGAFEMPAM